MYLSVYTWNWRTGAVDRLAENVGLEFVGWVLTPGKWAQSRVRTFWDRYVDLTGVQRENEVLKAKLEWQNLKLFRLEEKAAEADRLRRLLQVAPPKGWTLVGARIVAHRLGPNAVLQTAVISKGSRQEVRMNTPALTPEGVVGRVFRISPDFSSLLLVSDPNSRTAVLGQKTRTGGILSGQGPGLPLTVDYVAQNALLEEGEILVTSGLAEIFPKGLPVARVTRVERSDLSLFKTVHAEPLVQAQQLENVLLLLEDRGADPVDFPGVLPEG